MWSGPLISIVWITFHVTHTLQGCLHMFYEITFKEDLGASLVAQALRIRLPMRETRVQTLVKEDPTCRGATKPMRHNY